MIEKKEDCKAVIQKIDRYDIHLKGYNSYCHAKTLEEAEKIAKEMESEALAEWEKANSRETKEHERLELLNQSIGNYVAKLKKELWTLQHGSKTQITLAIIENLKEEIKHLKGFHEGKLACFWHNGVFRDSDSYTIEEVKEDDDDGS